MRALRSLLAALTSRTLWTFLGLALLCGLIWQFGALVSVGEAVPLASDLARGLVVGCIVVGWLLSLLAAQLRAARRNQLFVTELAAPAPAAPDPGAAAVAEVGARFRQVMAEMKRSRVGGRRFLRDMPWYLLIGPPGTGKTTALRQSGLHFPIDPGADLQGVGGTRNCDWFFTEQAVLVDTAGRYVQQQSDPEADAAEWSGFLDLLKRHRGRRALNGVIVALSMTELLGPEPAPRAHGREIRKRLSELGQRLQIRLPVYLMVTKADLVPGFETFFAPLPARGREQVWGATLAPDERPEGGAVDREARALWQELEARVGPRLAEEATLADRAEIFRFPARMAEVEAPLRALIATLFGESRYEDSPWLRGFYFTSATQEGSPIDRMLGDLAGAFGLSPPAPPRRARSETRSYFLHDLLAKVIFPEAGLGRLDRAAEERRRWLWRGSVAGAALATAVAGLGFLLSFLGWSGAIEDQARLTADLSARLANVAARQAPTEPLDLPLALDAATAADAARTEPPSGPLAFIGPSAAAEIERAGTIAYERTLANVLAPRMVALLEASMWRQVRDPDDMLGALKAYFMLTGLAPYDRDFLTGWWQEELPQQAVLDPFPTEAARRHQLAALSLFGTQGDPIPPDEELVAAALASICTIPLAARAYGALMQDPAVTGLPDWIPGDEAGPNGARIFTRLSGKTLRVGLPGAFTFAGFHETILPLVPEVAAQATLDRTLFAGGCGGSAGASAATLEADILKLYSDDFIARWDGLLRDIRLAPLTDFATATAAMKDLASSDSALKRLLAAVVAETDLTRVPAPDAAPPEGLLKAASKKLGKVGKLVKGAAALSAGSAPPTEPPGLAVARHFEPLKGMVAEVEGVPPRIGDAELALGALANALQTAAANPDPQAALTAQGGLPTLTGGLTEVAARLPPPIDAWLEGLATDTASVTREAAIARLNARYRADILPFCRAATAGRYPFEPGSAIDVNTADFQRLFGPGGLFDGFTGDALGPWIDTTRHPWAWRADLGLDARSLAPFEAARRMRDGLFAGGIGPVMGFLLQATDLSPNAARVTLSLDGQQLVYMNAATPPVGMTWPGQNGTNLIVLSFTPLDGSAEAVTSESGAWAWLRLIGKGSLSPTAQPDLFRLRLAAGAYAARFDLRANSVENPLDLRLFGGFRCPDGF
ncbi:type VI secretion system membrane subunit TssM [Cereibacter sphaeroides]|uniref:Type VI secretion system membrane subunit TssM n=1 Tax=Cereibacter sphaeroides TaxID=1063 RepID=A0AAX1UL30_CERSP|nr:type VI secretion system membrane subunit TssM [Cereibacter sphaeroides]RHZ95416.1 type VI secretion system membrane subunit TssM [Cereibacter sphaeroides]